MLVEWIRKEGNNQNLVIFFSGWSCEIAQFKDILSFENNDTLFISDYREISEFKWTDYKNYKNITVIAWSFGVFIASLIKMPSDWLKIAINGTLIPVNNEYGIPEKGFELTLKSIAKGGIRKFNSRISKSVEQYFTSTTRDNESLSEELQNLYIESQKNHNLDKNWDIAFISTEDMIFPTENQLNFWKKNGAKELRELKLPHYPFTPDFLANINEIVATNTKPI